MSSLGTQALGVALLATSASAITIKYPPAFSFSTSDGHVAAVDSAGARAYGTLPHWEDITNVTAWHACHSDDVLRRVFQASHQQDCSVWFQKAPIFDERSSCGAGPFSTCQEIFAQGNFPLEGFPGVDCPLKDDFKEVSKSPVTLFASNPGASRCSAYQYTFIAEEDPSDKTLMLPSTFKDVYSYVTYPDICHSLEGHTTTKYENIKFEVPSHDQIEGTLQSACGDLPDMPTSSGSVLSFVLGDSDAGTSESLKSVSTSTGKLTTLYESKDQDNFFADIELLTTLKDGTPFVAGFAGNFPYQYLQYGTIVDGSASLQTAHLEGNPDGLYGARLIGSDLYAFTKTDHETFNVTKVPIDSNKTEIVGEFETIASLTNMIFVSKDESKLFLAALNLDGGDTIDIIDAKTWKRTASHKADLAKIFEGAAFDADNEVIYGIRNGDGGECELAAINANTGKPASGDKTSIFEQFNCDQGKVACTLADGLYTCIAAGHGSSDQQYVVHYDVKTTAWLRLPVDATKNLGNSAAVWFVANDTEA